MSKRDPPQFIDPRRYHAFKKHVSPAFFRTFKAKAGQNDPFEQYFRFTSIDEGLTEITILQTIKDAIGVKEVTFNDLMACTEPEWVDGRVNYPTLTPQDLQLWAKRSIESIRVHYLATGEEDLQNDNPVILVSYPEEYCDELLNAFKAVVLPLLCRSYDSCDGKFTLEPNVPTINGRVAIAELTYQETDDVKEVLSIQIALWAGIFRQAKLRVPTILGTELVRFDSYWHLYYLFDNVGSGYPPRKPLGSHEFYVVNDNWGRDSI